MCGIYTSFDTGLAAGVFWYKPETQWNHAAQMPIVSLATPNPFIDGRQSERAMSVRCGVERYLWEAGWVTLPELTLKNGRRADIAALSPKGDVMIVEIKSSTADMKADQKWPDYHEFCDQLLFATLADVPADIFPDEAGLMIADQYGAEVLRPAPPVKLAPARRKAVHLQFARASAARLARCCEHAGFDSSTFADNA